MHQNRENTGNDVVHAVSTEITNNPFPQRSFTTGRGPRNCVKDEMIPSFIELTIWGHEHDNQGMPVRRTSDGQGFNVQPGKPPSTS